MDPQFTATREDLYHVQMDVKQVQAIQHNHADRLLRLEKRQADDAALKSVWGTGSPFPSVLSGTPQQGPVPNSTADVFDDFDDEQGHNLLGSLHLETDEEPVRRGASRANSVRFDVSALQGAGWAAGSRNSGEFGPMRPGSGFGSHPMTERSLSHKSDGRHSSTGHSVHSMHSVPSGRTSSLGLDTNFVIGGHGDDSPLDIPDPPPGLFVLGSVPSIIRCWLTTNFSHPALLYAVICTGSQKSVLDYSLVKDLGLAEHIHKDARGRQMIRLPVYLPEAIITQPSSRSNSPAPQLPTFSADFEIVGFAQRNNDQKGIRIFIGSDTLRAHNADVLFSQNLMTLYSDDRNKLSVPFVRPEDEAYFKNLCTTNFTPERYELKATAQPFTPTDTRPKIEPTPDAVTSALANNVKKYQDTQDQLKQLPEPDSPSTATFPSTESIRGRASSMKSVSNVDDNTLDSEKHPDTMNTSTDPDISESSNSDSTRRNSTGIWGSWRQSGSAMSQLTNGTGDADALTTSGYQRATRGGGRSMKVLKPASSKSLASSTITGTNVAPAVPTRSTTTARTGASYEPAPPTRVSGELRRKSQAENVPLKWEPKRGSLEAGSASSLNSNAGVSGKTLGGMARSSNPVGGASAFAWMNPQSKGKASATAAE